MLIIIALALLVISFLVMYLPLSVLELRYKLSGNGRYWNTRKAKYEYVTVFHHFAKAHLTFALFYILNTIFYAYLLSYALTELKYELPLCLLLYAAIIICISLIYVIITDLYRTENIIDGIRELELAILTLKEKGND